MRIDDCSKLTTDKLLELLKHADQLTQLKAIVELSRRNEVKATTQLVELLKSSRLRHYIASVLGTSGKREVVDKLYEFVNDEDYVFRISCREALARLGDHRVFEALLEVVLGETTHSDICNDFIEALRTLDDERTQPTLIRILSESIKTFEREKAAYALSFLGNAEATPALVQALEDKEAQVRASATDALQEIGGKGFVSEFIRMVSDSDEEVRLIAVGALRQVGDPLGCEALAKALYDSNHEVSWIASLALQKIGTPEALQALSTWKSSRHQGRRD